MMKDSCEDSLSQPCSPSCPLLQLPGELRNRIYGFIIERSKNRVLHKIDRHEDNTGYGEASISKSYFGLAQACRSIRSELVPLYKAHTVVHIDPEALYDYIHTFLAVPGTSDDKIVGSVVMDLMFSATICKGSRVDIKPLLSLLRRAENLFVGLHDIVSDEDVISGFDVGDDSPPRSVQDLLVMIYDIVDMDAFYDYVEQAMTMLEIEYDDNKGLEIVFELGPAHWEEWMGLWSKPDHLPDYRIPLELSDKVVEWGRGCGMALNREEGSHLTVNYRLGA